VKVNIIVSSCVYAPSTHRTIAERADETGFAEVESQGGQYPSKQQQPLGNP